MHLGTRLYTLLFSKQVGCDEFGNRYFEAKHKNPYSGRKSRWVIYKGINDPSKVPPAWHAWLHFTSEAPLFTKTHKWQKEHLPNRTGTKYAYFPPGHPKAGEKRHKATGDYQAWTPN